MHLPFFPHLTLILPFGPEPFPLLVKSLVCTLSFTSSLITGVMILMRINHRADWCPTLIKVLNTTLAGNTKLAKLLPAPTKPTASLGVTGGIHLCFLNALSLRKGTSVPSALGKVSPLRVALQGRWLNLFNWLSLSLTRGSRAALSPMKNVFVEVKFRGEPAISACLCSSLFYSTALFNYMMTLSQLFMCSDFFKGKELMYKVWSRLREYSMWFYLTYFRVKTLHVVNLPGF